MRTLFSVVLRKLQINYANDMMEDIFNKNKNRIPGNIMKLMNPSTKSQRKVNKLVTHENIQLFSLGCSTLVNFWLFSNRVIYTSLAFPELALGSYLLLIEE